MLLRYLITDVVHQKEEEFNFITYLQNDSLDIGAIYFVSTLFYRKWQDTQVRERKFLEGLENR